MSSNFENLPLPVKRDSQDYFRIVPANETVEIPVVGDFMYCKQAEGSIKVQVNGKIIDMEAGDERIMGGEDVFRGVSLINDTASPKLVTFVIGFGRFNRRIVRGEITAELRLRTATGEYIDDTRKTINLDVEQLPGSGLTETQGTTIARIPFDYGFSIDDNSTTFKNPSENSYNPAVHDGIIVLGQRTNNNGYYAIEVNPLTNELIRELGNISDLGQPRVVTRIGTTLYQTNTFNSEGIYEKPVGGSWTRIHAQNDLGLALTPDATGENLFFTRSNGSAIYKLNLATNTITESVSTVEIMSYLGWDGDNLIAFSTANYRPEVYDQNLNLVTRLGNTQDADEGGVIYANYLFKRDGTGADQFDWLVEPIESVTDLFVGRANDVCLNSWLGPKPDQFDTVRTAAEITVNNAESGTPTVSGELIRLIMEWFKGEKLPADYMDYIFAIEIFSGTNLDGISFPPIKIQSQGQTLLAAGVVDNFSMVFPISAKITIDNRFEEL